jgi:hypothetical protein
LSSAVFEFRRYKKPGEAVMAQLDDAQLHTRATPTVNSVDIIVRHLAGNTKSRWTHFITEDGEKPWRMRDEEFQPPVGTREDLIRHWEERWRPLFQALDSLGTKGPERNIHLRNQSRTVTQAILRQLAHSPYHVGQMVFTGKQLEGEAWEYQSIAPSQRATYNQQYFGPPQKEG